MSQTKTLQQSQAQDKDYSPHAALTCKGGVCSMSEDFAMRVRASKELSSSSRQDTRAETSSNSSISIGLLITSIITATPTYKFVDL